MTLSIRIQTGSSVPLYQQIVEQVKAAVVSGSASEGDPLPSVRGLAARLVVNANTVAKAYAELCREGVTRSERGRGVFIARHTPTRSKRERRRQLQPLIHALVQEARFVGMDEEDLVATLVGAWERTAPNTDEKSGTRRRPGRTKEELG